MRMLLPIPIDEKKIFSLFQTLELHEIIFKHLKTQKTDSLGTYFLLHSGKVFFFKYLHLSRLVLLTRTYQLSKF
jgi:hypothetical protein